MDTFKSEQHLTWEVQGTGNCHMGNRGFFFNVLLKPGKQAAPHINTVITILNHGNTTPLKNIQQVRNNLNFAFESHIGHRDFLFY